MSTSTKPKPRIVTNTIEELKDVGKNTVKNTVSEIANTFSFAEFLGMSEPSPSAAQERIQKDVEKKTEEKQKESSTPLSQEVLNQIAKDAQELEKTRRHLTDLVKSDEAKAIQALRQEEEEKKQEEIALEQQKAQELQRQQQMNQQDSLPQGKQKGKMGQARKKATTAPAQNFESKSNKGK